MNLVVWCAVALGGPSVRGWAGQVPDASLRDAVGDGKEGVVDGGPVRFSRGEDEGALQVDSVESGRTKV